MMYNYCTCSNAKEWRSLNKSHKLQIRKFADFNFFSMRFSKWHTSEIADFRLRNKPKSLQICYLRTNKKNCVPTSEHCMRILLYLVSPLLPGLTSSGRVDRSLILVSQPIFRQITAHLCWGVSHMVEAPGRILAQHGLWFIPTTTRGPKNAIGRTP